MSIGAERLRASTSFSPDEVKVLLELTRALERRDREFLDRVPRLPEFLKLVRKVQTLQRRVTAAARMRGLLVDVQSGVLDRSVLDAELRAAVETAATKEAERVEKRRKRDEWKLSSMTPRGIKNREWKARAEEIRERYLREVASGVTGIAAFNRARKMYPCKVTHLKRVLSEHMLDRTRMRLGMGRQEAAE